MVRCCGPNSMRHALNPVIPARNRTDVVPSAAGCQSSSTPAGDPSAAKTLVLPSALGCQCLVIGRK